MSRVCQCARQVVLVFASKEEGQVARTVTCEDSDTSFHHRTVIETITNEIQNEWIVSQLCNVWWTGVFFQPLFPLGLPNTMKGVPWPVLQWYSFSHAAGTRASLHGSCILMFFTFYFPRKDRGIFSCKSEDIIFHYCTFFVRSRKDLTSKKRTTSQKSNFSCKNTRLHRREFLFWPFGCGRLMGARTQAIGLCPTFASRI